MTSHDDGTPSATAGSDANAATQGTTPGDMVFALGALVVVAADLIGWIVAEDYYMGELMWGLAALGLATVLLHRMRNRAFPVAYGWVISAVGLAALVVGVRLFLMDVTNDLFDRGGGTVLFAIVTYAGAALMAVGAVRSRS